MKYPLPRRLRTALFVLLAALDAPRALLADPPREAAAAFDAYCRTVEQRLARQHAGPASFLTGPPPAPAPHADGLRIERINQSPEVPGGARLDHWRGVAFVPGANAAQFEELLRGFSSYPATFAPQVLSARAEPAGPNRLLATMRVRQHHVLTVVMDASYDVSFEHEIAAGANAARGYSLSRSTRITEIEAAGTKRERALSPADEHGFLWRLNTYWSWQERDGGLAIQIEAVSLSRSVPRGLGWVVGPYVESIPRDSLTFTLTSARDALLRHAPHPSAN